jgi:hypothetical protein
MTPPARPTTNGPWVRAMNPIDPVNQGGRAIRHHRRPAVPTHTNDKQRN